MESDTQQLARELERLGLTASDMAGPYAWVAKALNPSSPQIDNVDGVPDYEGQDSLKMSWRQVTDIDKGSLTLATTDTWEIDMLLFEGPAVLGAYQARKTGDPSVHHEGWILNENYKFYDAAQPLGPHVNPAVAPDVGEVVVEENSQFQRDFIHFRPTFAGFTMHFDAAALTNQGRVVAAQVPNAWSKKGYAFASLPAPTAPGALEAVVGSTSAGIATWGNATELATTGINQSTIVPKYTNTLQASTTSGTWTSKDGCYLPLRFSDPTLKYAGSQETQPASSFRFVHPWQDIVGSDVIPPAQVGPVFYHPFPLTTNMRAGVICIRGIAPTSTLSLHSRIGYELTVPAGTGYSALLTKCAECSNAAVEKYFVLRRQLADVYPAKYNDDELLQKIINGIGKTVGDVLPEGKWKSMVKMLTPLVSGAAGMMSGGSKAKAGSRMRSKRPEDVTAEDVEVDMAAGSGRGPGRKARGGASAASNGRRKRGVRGAVGGAVKTGAKAIGGLIRGK